MNSIQARQERFILVKVASRRAGSVFESAPNDVTIPGRPAEQCRKLSFSQLPSVCVLVSYCWGCSILFLPLALPFQSMKIMCELR